MPRNGPSRLTRSSAWNPSSVCRSTWAVRHKAALLTSAETVPKAPTARATTVAQLSGSATSWRTYRPWSPSSAATARPSSSRTSVTTTRAAGLRAQPGLGRALAASGTGDEDDLSVEGDGHGPPFLALRKYS